MRFTPIFFASAVAAAGYYPAPVSSAPASSSTPYDSTHGYGGYKASSSSSSSSAAGYGGAWPAKSSSSSSAYVKKWKTTTSYSTECYTVTSSSSTKVWTSVKAYPTVCEDDDDETWGPKTSAKSTPYSPVKPTGSSIPYCAAVTETCTVTVTATATGGSDYTPKPKPTSAYTAGADSDAWPKAYPKPSGTGSYTKPAAPQFTGAASAQKAGAFLAGAGAVAAMFL